MFPAHKKGKSNVTFPFSKIKNKKNSSAFPVVNPNVPGSAIVQITAAHA